MHTRSLPPQNISVQIVENFLLHVANFEPSLDHFSLLQHVETEIDSAQNEKHPMLCLSILYFHNLNQLVEISQSCVCVFFPSNNDVIYKFM